MKVYTGSDKSATRIQCALGRVNAVRIRNRQTERAYCQTMIVSHFPQSSSAVASLHVVRAATMSALILIFDVISSAEIVGRQWRVVSLV